jgi:Zn-dependent peptidase ImmA (M78 family)/transcriptional regulator with XRE-family HTH domain
MMATDHVDVAPAVLVWARESIGLSREEAAKKLKMTPTDLQFLEEGVGDVSMPKLRLMAKVYDRPLIAFFLPEPLPSDDGLPDFRQTPENFLKPWSPELHEAYRRVAGQREVALELAELVEEPLLEIDLVVRLGDDPEDVGEEVRAWLGSPERSSGSPDPYQVFNSWVRRIEDRDVLVTQVTGIDTQEMRGFSIGDRPLPAIAINSGDAVKGKTFTLMHELTHVLLRRSSLCDLEDVPAAADPDAQRLERFCNEVAAATLMPRRAVLGEPAVRAASDGSAWSDADLAYLAGRFGVSEEAMLLRLITLKRASREFYWERRRHFVLRRSADCGQSAGFITYYNKQIRNLGRRYIRTVLHAYNRDEITDADLSRYLGMKLKYVPTLVETLEGGRWIEDRPGRER